MRIVFLAADLEENLAAGILSAVVERDGHEAHVVPFNDASETSRAVARALALTPDVIGLSIQFQHRAPEFLALAARLRDAGYRGHVTSGGQFPTLAWKETLGQGTGVDTVVLHDGEETLVDLLRAIAAGTSLHAVAGLALRADDGAPIRTAARRLPDDLDAIPFAKRYRAHGRHMEIPFIPIIGGRGCWGRCNYCSIISFYDDAIESGGGKAVRVRSPENVAAEMALLLDQAGGRAIFCFHDDNFVFPRESLSRERVRAIRAALDDYDVGEVAIVGKARPDCITPELAKELAALGVIRLYVGVENGSEAGGAALRRGTQQSHIETALRACREAGIFVCYNLLVFEPGATIADVEENVRFIRAHADHPVNFCRAEPYFGTALHDELAASQNLGGSWLGFNYRIEDARTELLFRICSAAFRERNFAPAGVANRYMGLGYAANVLARFHDRDGDTRELAQRARLLTRAISLDTARLLDKAIELAKRAPLDDWDAIERATARLGLEVAEADRAHHAALDELYRDMRAHAKNPRPPRRAPTPNARFTKLRRTFLVGVSMSAALASYQACGGEVKQIAGASSSGSGEGGMVVDPPPPDGGHGGRGGHGGAGGEGGMVVDPLPPDAGHGGMGGSGGMGQGGMVNDPPPPDAGFGLLDIPRDEPDEAPRKRSLRLIDQWFDTSPKAAVRTIDLPLFDPPRAKLAGRRDGDRIHARLEGGPSSVGTRWEADGAIEGEGVEVVWAPASDDDRLRVAVRSRGGVAILSMKASEAAS